MKKLLRKIRLRGGILLLTLIAIACFSLGNAAGAGKLVGIEAFLNDSMTIMLHGKKFVAKEEDGSAIVPITYRGRTYLPLRAIAEATGLKVQWDGKTQTAYLGAVEGEIDPGELTYTRVNQDFSYNDHRYRTKELHSGELTTAGGETFDFGYVTGKGNYSVDIRVALDYKYHSFKARAYIDSELPEHLGEGGTGTVTILDENDIPLKSFTAKKGEIIDIQLDNLTTVKTLQISVEGDRSILGEPMIGMP
jgi:Copper amine oxidase N-terminal domain.